MDFADVGIDDLAAGDVLENVRRVREIENQRRHHRQIAAVVLVKRHIRTILERGPRPGDHLTAHIDGVDLSEDVRKRACEPAGAASDLEHAHLAIRLVDVGGVGQDLVGDGLLAGSEKSLIGPVGAAGVDKIARVLAGARSQSRCIRWSCSSSVMDFVFMRTRNTQQPLSPGQELRSHVRVEDHDEPTTEARKILWRRVKRNSRPSSEGPWK